MNEDEPTTAPVVSWIAIRMFLVMTMLVEWVTVSIDFSNAFVQAKLPKPTWIHLPQGLYADRPNVCLKLKKVSKD
jgi:hypothetical protein